MFSRFATALYNAVDALAPPLPLREEFVYHWKAVTKYFTSKNASSKMPIELTGIPSHLSEMLSFLQQEQEELEAGSIGPCMEYLIEYKLLETMFVLGTTDAPPGMKCHMLMFATNLLKLVQQFLIPHVGVYIPMTKFIRLCGETLAAPTEKEEIDFLEAICDKLTENPHLVNCFMGIPNTELSEKTQNHQKPLMQNGTSGAGDVHILTSDNETHVLISALLMLFSSPDNAISGRASECLKTCCSLANDTAAFAIVQNTNLSKALCNGVLSFYQNIPKKMKLNDIEDPILEYSEEDDAAMTQKISLERRKFLCYLKNLHFFDTIVQQAHPVILDDLTSKFKSVFLDTVVYHDLVTNENKDHNLFCTAVISMSIRHLSSSKLISAFGFFLLGDIENFDISGHSSHIVKDTLITRCRDSEKNVQLSIASLQLFEELLQQPSQFILSNLVTNYVEGRGYYDHTASDDWFSFSDDDASGTHGNEPDDSLRSSTANSTFAPPYIHRILDAFLSLLPDDIKSAENEEDAGYDTYIKEARCRFIKCLMHSEDFDWPQEPMSKENYQIGFEDDASSDSQPEADSCWKFWEGPFLSMLFDKIEHMIDLPYDICLQVTSLISRLALFAHPNLHEYLLNPLIPYSLGARSLFSVLLTVSEGIQESVKNVKSFKQKIRLTRKSLLSEDSQCEAFPESNALEVLIVIEEFCKELAAIAFVKYNAAS